MTSKRILYGNHMSPPVRAVHMTLEALELDYEFKLINEYAGETRTAEFLKKNPQHSIPTLEETDGKSIWDSHAILAYLARKYGKNDAYYPKDFYERAIVDQRLHFENGILFISLSKGKIAPLIRGEIKYEQLCEVKTAINEAYALLEIFLSDNGYMAGKTLTIADFSILSTVSTLALFEPIVDSKYPKLAAWLENMKKLPYYGKVHDEGLKQLNEKIQAQLEKYA